MELCTISSPSTATMSTSSEKENRQQEVRRKKKKWIIKNDELFIGKRICTSGWVCRKGPNNQQLDGCHGWRHRLCYSSIESFVLLFVAEVLELKNIPKHNSTGTQKWGGWMTIVFLSLIDLPTSNEDGKTGAVSADEANQPTATNPTRNSRKMNGFMTDPFLVPSTEFPPSPAKTIFVCTCL